MKAPEPTARAARFVVVCGLYTLGALRSAGATPPPTEEEAKRLREAAAETECLHCAGRGDPQSQDYRPCAYLTPYGFERGARYLDGPRYGHFFCRPRKREAEPLPEDLRAKAENGEDDVVAQSGRLPLRDGCSSLPLPSHSSPIVPLPFLMLALVALRRPFGSARASPAPASSQNGPLM